MTTNKEIKIAVAGTGLCVGLSIGIVPSSDRSGCNTRKGGESRLSSNAYDILTRILCGEEVDALFLPCGYVRRYESGMDADISKPTPSVA